MLRPEVPCRAAPTARPRTLLPSHRRVRATLAGATASAMLLAPVPALADPDDDRSRIGSVDSISIAAARVEPPTIDPSRSMTTGELVELQAYDEATYPEYFRTPDGHLSRAPAFWPGHLMLFVGKSALNAALSYGFKEGMNQIMPSQPDPMAAALDQIAEQLHGLRDQIQGVSDQVLAVGEQVEELKQMHEWSVYFDRERDVETYKANVHLYSDLVAGYERYGQWDETKARAVVDKSVQALSQIEIKLVNGTDPAFQNLLKILRYSLPDARWEQVDSYRRSYESVLSTAVLNVMAAHERFPGLFQSELDAAIARHDRTVEALYAVGGVAYPQPMRFSEEGAPTPVGGQLHPFGKGYLVASGDRPLLEGEKKALTVTDYETFLTVFEELRDDFLRAHTSGEMTFSHYLTSLGFPMWVELADAVYVGAIGSEWRVYHEMGHVSGDKLNHGWKYPWQRYPTKAAAEAAANELRATFTARAPYTLEVETNPAGLAISGDVDALELAMTGAPISWDADQAGPGGEMGPLWVESAKYDTMVFADAGTSRRLGVFDLKRGTINDAVIESPESGVLAVVVGRSVPGEASDSGVMVPVGISLLNAVQPSATGELVFRPIARTVERVHIAVVGTSDVSGIRIYMSGRGHVCGASKGAPCTVEVQVDSGPVTLTNDPGLWHGFAGWHGPCVNGGWSGGCTLDLTKGEQEVRGAFYQSDPR